MLAFLRLVLLGVHFLLAGLLGLCLALMRPFNPDNTRRAARLYAWPALRILGLRLRAQDTVLRSLPRASVIIANHQSNFDLFALGGVVPPRTVSLGKTSLKWIPVFGQLYWLAGNVLVNRSNPRAAKRAMEATTTTLRERDTSIWIFPEGTRNHGGGLLSFKKGAFLMAINAGAPIVPVCVSNYRRDMRLNRWRGGEVRVQALMPIDTTGLTPEDVPALVAHCEAVMAAGIEALDRGEFPGAGPIVSLSDASPRTA